MATSHLGTDWSDQWERVERWKARLDVIREALPGDGPAKTSALDDVYAFFMNCFHLGDWVWRSGAKTKDEVRDFIKNDPDMRLCPNVCTGLKHFRVKPAQALADSNWSTATTYVPIGFTADGMRMGLLPARHIVTSSGGRDMFVTADRCVAAWRRFLGI